MEVPTRVEHSVAMMHVFWTVSTATVAREIARTYLEVLLLNHIGVVHLGRLMCRVEVDPDPSSAGRQY